MRSRRTAARLASAMVSVMAAGLATCTAGCTGAPPAGGTIVFVALSYRGPELGTIRPDGSGTRILLSYSRASNTEMDCPRWSPDGKQILVTIASVPPGRNQQNSLYVVNADGTGLRRLTTREAGLCGSWSPDGRKIVFTGVTPRRPWVQILIKNLSTGKLTQLPSGPGGYEPAWSPDGGRIAFEGGMPGTALTCVYVEDLASGKVRRVTGVLSDGGFAWSPDGRRIVYDGGRGAMLVVNLSTGVTSRLGRGAMPAWSPGGTQMVFVWPTSPCGDLYVRPVTGSGRTRLTNEAADRAAYCDPSWAP